jgi:hypothetical protein
MSAFEDPEVRQLIKWVAGATVLAEQAVSAWREGNPERLRDAMQDLERLIAVVKAAMDPPKKT